jgi:hypothetical protein
MKKNDNGITIKLVDFVGSFAENKDTAQKLRKEQILLALERNQVVVLDFEGVSNTTQSFIHALISEPIREHGINVLDRMIFKSCNSKVQSIVSIVTDYMQYEP